MKLESGGTLQERCFVQPSDLLVLQLYLSGRDLQMLD